MFVLLTEDVDVSITECISMNIASIALDHLQITATVTAVLAGIGQDQLCTTTHQTHPIWHPVRCNTISITQVSK